MEEYLKHIMQASCMVLIFFMSDLMNNAIKKIWAYLFVFFMTLGMLYTFNISASNMEYFYVKCMIYEDDEDYVDPDEDEWTKCEHHLKFAAKYYMDAQKITWFLPEYSDKEKAKLCFSSVCIGAAPAPAYIKFIAITLNLFSQYGLDCIDRYQQVTNILHRAQYHAEMFMFYDEILKQYTKGY